MIQKPSEPKNDQEDIKHILESYDRRDDAFKSKKPASPNDTKNNTMMKINEDNVSS